MTDAHVLVVDDDELHRELVADYLTLGGFAVRQARDGREALALMGQEVPALVMLDVQMPELDGVAVVAAMRRDAALAEVPVLFLSGVAAPHLRIRALELGADDFISKQCPPAEILARVGMHAPPPKPRTNPKAWAHCVLARAAAGEETLALESIRMAERAIKAKDAA